MSCIYHVEFWYKCFFLSEFLKKNLLLIDVNNDDIFIRLRSNLRSQQFSSKRNLFLLQESPEDCFTLQFYDNHENPLAHETVSVRKGKSLK